MRNGTWACRTRTASGIDAYWRMTPRQKIRLMYFDTSQEATKTLDDEIIFRRHRLSREPRRSRHFETQVIELAYEFTFVKRDMLRPRGIVRHP